ncbi:MAG: glycosyltransferase [Planctomycetes bacterium]|nr:glycosyltransferase [Planctomycetota bacterium]
MKLLFVNQFYAPDFAATAQILADLAEHLASHGHEVHVLCSRGKYDDGTARPTPREETLNGVHVHRLSAPGFGKSNMLGRIVDYAAFHLLCGGWMLAHGDRFDAIVTLTTPPLIGLYATFVRTKHICWAMDLHPDVEFELGIWSRKHPAWRFLHFLNALHFRRADATVALGEAMKDRLAEKGVERERIVVIPPWSRADQIRVIDAAASPLRRDQKLDGKFVVMYSGNAGLIHTFDAVRAAMRELANDPRFAFVFIGSGRRLEEITEPCLKLPYQPRDGLSETLGAADVHLVTLRNGMTGTAVPSKLYGIMAAGRAAIFLGPADADTALDLRAAESGFVLKGDDSAGLVAALRRLADNPAECEQLGRNARAAFEQSYEHQVCCEQFEGLLESVVG